MKVPYIVTPGPTEVRENVRLARAKRTTNPDLDLQFYDFYKETCEKIGEFLKTKNQVRILSGEGILGLEAACASLTEKGDKVLVIENGIFGEGFADFVSMYGGDVTILSFPREKKIDIDKLENYLKENNDFKYATVVHCDTPSGILNDIDKICPMLNKYGILTVVDSVAAMGGEDIRVDDWKIDIAIGATQKCVSAPPGLTFLSISDKAFTSMKKRKTPISSFYCNLLVWQDYYEKKWFPYTPPISDIIGLRTAMDNIKEDNKILERHKKIAEATRKAIVLGGLELYTKGGYSNTVTVFKVPKEINEKQIRKYMLDKYNILIAGSFGYLEGKVIRIGHMGENAVIHKIAYTLFAIQKSFEKHGFTFKNDMVKIFLSEF
ncbi:serine-pyruvate aminotransferase [Clostridium acetireducens DSM 10703]|jgi:aspartate aminotransferase-like enzyme|uniref:Serine-pyruvate aminotransferase n=1 Tax=Clostridium acetireducens DSM 10703 TaxID=1121290 RepID=A0A1E8EVI1_9CLOT|nr:alanine--glyoxylate aminotransferase family protein [Clostridium acetireducens]OFH99500.1 serine-pyruvate aminotransferase [Clostridium acetireducens DSM 10703]